MATIGNASADPVPLIRSNDFGRGLRRAAHFLRHASNRRMLRSPTLYMRDGATESSRAFSRSVLFLDILWNLAFVMVAAGVLIFSFGELPAMPLRVWVVGYMIHCAMHMVYMYMEYRGSGSRGSSESGSSRDNEENLSTAKHLESANTMFSFIWWIIGFYWLSTGGQAMIHEAPKLYWLCMVLLAFDVFFVVFCVFLACLAGMGVCCCLPCVIAILYLVPYQDGASKEDIHRLPKYKFRRMEGVEGLVRQLPGPFGGIMSKCGSDTPIEHVLSAKDADCCICITPYDDGVELRELPCSHHFHCGCIDKWLIINATCPLCKFSIMKSGYNGREEV